MAAFAVSSLEAVTVTASHGSAAAAYGVGRAHVYAVPSASALPFHYCPSPSLPEGLYHWQSQALAQLGVLCRRHWNLLALQAIRYGSASSLRHGQASPPASFSIAQIVRCRIGWVGGLGNSSGTETAPSAPRLPALPPQGHGMAWHVSHKLPHPSLPFPGKASPLYSPLASCLHHCPVCLLQGIGIHRLITYRRPAPSAPHHHVCVSSPLLLLPPPWAGGPEPLPPRPLPLPPPLSPASFGITHIVCCWIISIHSAIEAAKSGRPPVCRQARQKRTPGGRSVPDGRICGPRLVVAAL